MTRTVLGHDVQRVEDPALLTGEADFVADIPADRVLHAVFVRSTVTHAVVTGIDTAEASNLDGVVEVVTARELSLPSMGEEMLGPLARPLLATDRVRFVGEPVAVVVAESHAA